MDDIETSIHPDVEIIFSNRQDGSMLAIKGKLTPVDAARNVDKFLAKNNFPLQRSRVWITYDDNRSYVDVIRVDQVNANQEILADALYTTEPSQVITLPVADCIATVVYDPKTSLLGVLHLGRHSSVAGLIEHFVIEVADNLGSDPHDWYVWMSPSIRQAHDRLDYFTPPNLSDWSEFMHTASDGKIHIDTVGYNRARFIRAGVAPERIGISPLDTYQGDRFYSHRAYLESGDTAMQGRMMVAVRRLT